MRLNNQYKALWVEFRLANLDAQLRRGLQGSACVGRSTAGKELDRLCEQGELDRALGVLECMDRHGSVPSGNMYCALLKACAKRRALGHAKRVHAHLAKYGLESSRFVGEYVVGTLVKCGGLEDALRVFDKLPYRSVFSWTALMSGYTTAGRGQEALNMYRCMREEGLVPDKHTFISLIRACCNLSDLEEGKSIHAEVLKFSCESDSFVGTSLVDMYGKCGSLVDAQVVFDGLFQRNVVSWTAMLAAYTQAGHAEKSLQTYLEMQEDGWSPDNRAIVGALQACGMLAEKEVDSGVVQCSKPITLQLGKAVHAYACRKGYDSDVFVGSTLISMFGKCGSSADAQVVFHGLPHRSVVVWNALLTAYVQQGQAETALQLYEVLREEGIPPDDLTCLSTLQASGMLADKEEDVMVDGQSIKPSSLEKVKALHADSRRYSFDVFFGSTLVSVYGKCGSIRDAQHVFDALPQRNVVTWTAMLAAYVEQGQAEQALHLCCQMQEEGVEPNDHTYVSLVLACSILANKEGRTIVDGCLTKSVSLALVKAIHASSHQKGYASENFVGSSLVSVYHTCGSIVDAQHVFEGLSQRDVVSWNAMFMAYAQQGKGEKVLQLYRQMREEGVTPDDTTRGCIMQVSSDMGSLDVCREIHLSVVSTGGNLSTHMANTLIHAYGRCSSMVDAQKVFDSMPQHDVVSWNALIAGYSRQGNFFASLQSFEEMRFSDVTPDGVTFLSVLSACSHSGLVDRGTEYFESMTKDYHIGPQIGHYVSLVDLLGRAGYFASIEKLLATMPMEPDLAMWLCLLNACRKHDKVLLGEVAFNFAVELQPQHAATYLLMSNIYAAAGHWDRAKEVRQLGKLAGAWKNPGQSWIDHEHDVQTFVAGDCNHPHWGQLHSLIRNLSLELEGAHISQRCHISNVSGIRANDSLYDVQPFGLLNGILFPASEHI